MSMTGTVVRWNDRGFGFIKPAEGGDDVFCHANNISDGNALDQGATVQYDQVFDDQKGKYRAENCTGGIQMDRGGGGGGYQQQGGGGYQGGGGSKGDSDASGPCTGTAMRWNGERGFGFIKPDDGGEDVFCHFRDLADGDSLEEGSKVSFERVFNDRKGKYSAQNVVVGVQEQGHSRGEEEGEEEEAKEETPAAKTEEDVDAEDDASSSSSDDSDSSSDSDSDDEDEAAAKKAAEEAAAKKAAEEAAAKKAAEEKKAAKKAAKAAKKEKKEKKKRAAEAAPEEEASAKKKTKKEKKEKKKKKSKD